MPKKVRDTAARQLRAMGLDQIKLGHPISLQPLTETLDENELLALLNAPPAQSGLYGTRMSAPARQLCEWVDEWLESGRNSNGVEDPHARHFKMKIEPESLEERLWTLSAQYLRVLPYGTQLALCLWKPEPGIGGKPSQSELQASMLLRLMASDLRFRIAKCRDCSIYYLLRPRTILLKKGTRCTACYEKKRGAEQKKRMKDRRKDSRRSLWIRVAEKFGANIAAKPKWYEDRGVVEKIVDGLNDELRSIDPSRAPVTSKWVVRKPNREGISREVSRRSSRR